MTTNESNSIETEELERRKALKPVPDNIYATLNECQRLALTRFESFGWSVKFVRRFNVSKPLIVVGDPSGKDYAVLDEDGNLDRTTNPKIR